MVGAMLDDPEMPSSDDVDAVGATYGRLMQRVDAGGTAALAEAIEALSTEDAKDVLLLVLTRQHDQLGDERAKLHGVAREPAARPGPTRHREPRCSQRGTRDKPAISALP